MNQDHSGVNGKPFKPQEGANGNVETPEDQTFTGSAERLISEANAVSGEYSFQSHCMRTLTMEGEIWFYATDVCDVLELTNPRKVIDRLDTDQKGVTTRATRGGRQTVNVINESGLYALIFSSRKPQANSFRRWVTGEVLPAIRRTGFYSRDGERPDAGDAIVIPTPDELTRYVVLAGRGIEPSIRRTDPMDTIAEYGALDLDALCFALKSIHVWWKKAQIGLSLHPEATKGFAIAQLDFSVRNGIRIVDQYFGRQDGP